MIEEECSWGPVDAGIDIKELLSDVEVMDVVCIPPRYTKLVESYPDLAAKLIGEGTVRALQNWPGNATLGVEVARVGQVFYEETHLSVWHKGWLRGATEIMEDEVLAELLVEIEKEVAERWKRRYLADYDEGSA